MARPWLFVLVFYIVVFASLYFPVLSGHESLKTNIGWPAGPLFVGDPTAGGPITMPQERIVAAAWSHGQLPLWMPFEGYGMNLGGDQGVAWFLPEVLFHLLFPNNFSVWNVVRMMLLAFFTYLFARDLKVSTLPAALAGLFVSLSGPAIPNINLGMDNPLMLFPIMLFFANRQISTSGKHRILWSLSLAAAISQAFLAGFDEVLPLEILVIGLFALVRIFSSEKPGRSNKLVSLLLFMLSVIVGVAGSAIATLELIEPLSSYFSYQDSFSFLSHATHLWIVTLVDPWFFGRSVAAMQFGMGETEWAYGNPFVWILAILTIPLIVVSKDHLKKRAVLILFWALVAIGVLGLSNFLGVLNLFDVPVFNLIVMARFLPFMWWLPLSVLAAFGLDMILSVRRRNVLLPIVSLGLLNLLAIAFVIIRGPVVFPLASTDGIRSFVVNNWLFYVLLFVASFVVVICGKRYRRFLLALLSAASLVIYLPKDFFPTPQNGSFTVTLATHLRQTGRSNYLTYAPDYPFSSTSLAENGINNIQAFGVFYPRAYVNLIMALFISSNGEGLGDNLYPASPVMSDIALDPKNIDKMYDLGVRNLVLISPISEIPSLYGSIEVNSAWRGKYETAIKTIARIYESRPDLQTAFPYGSKDFSRELINWAVTAGLTIDSSHVQLDPYKNRIIQLHRVFISGNKSELFELQTNRDLPSIQFEGKVTAEAQSLYVYALGSGTGLLWVPKEVVNSGGSTTSRVQLTSEIVSNQDSAYVSTASTPSYIVQTPGFNAQLTGWTPGEQYQIGKLRANSAGFVVFRSQYTKNQIVYVNGRPVPFYSVDGAFTGFDVPKGDDVIQFDYLTSARQAAWIVTLFINIALILGIIIFYVPYFKKLRKPPLPQL